MAFVPSFTSSESLSSPENVTFVDTSTDPPVGLTSRRIYIRLVNGNWLTTAGESTTEVYETWPIADTSITLDLLTQSTSADVTVKWMTGSTVTDEVVDEPMEWDLYDYLFGLELIQGQTATPAIIQDQNYYSNFFQFITNIWCSESAIIYGEDIYSSQGFLNRNQNMIANSDFYF